MKAVKTAKELELMQKASDVAAAGLLWLRHASSPACVR